MGEQGFCEAQVEGSNPSGGLEVYNMSKKAKQDVQRRRVQQIKSEPPNQEILDSIGSPNAWTPEAEDAWLEELRKIPARIIHQRFPPMKKPSNVSRRGKNNSG